MRNTALCIGALACVAPWLLGSVPAGNGDTAAIVASGNGAFAYETHEEGRIHDDVTGRAFVKFDVQREDGKVTGTMLVAAEDHHEEGFFPHVVIRVHRIDEAAFKEHSVKMFATGRLHNSPVEVEAVAIDGQQSGDADSFSIKCIDDDDEVIFEAHGELFQGDIIVGEPE